MALVIPLGQTTLAADSSLRDSTATKPSGRESATAYNRALKATAAQVAPYSQVATHNIANMQVGQTNLGQFGTGYVGEQTDPVTGEPLPSCIFPANTGKNHLYIGAFWIGAIVGRDTLVSSGADDLYNVHEFWPGALDYSDDTLYRETIIPESDFFSETALSEQDIVATYFDTLIDPSSVGSDAIDGRPHRPLNIKVVERSLQWSYSYAQDFVMFDYKITNNGFRALEKVFMGIYVDADVHHRSKSALAAYGEDIAGFKRDLPAECGYRDTINVAYVIDNDGDPEEGLWDLGVSVRSAAGVRLIRTPAESLQYSYNWWSAPPGVDFGPRMAGTLARPFRDMDGYIGPPAGDRNKYYIMTNGEFDYEQLFTAVDHTAEGWMKPPPQALSYALGGDPRYLLSFGPFTVFPGETLPITFAYVAGDHVHRRPNDYKDLLEGRADNPTPFYNTLDFTELGRTSLWAEWIYDNPGVDTDGDGYRGKYRICYGGVDHVVYDTFLNPVDTTIIDSIRADTVYADSTIRFYQGDGVPDFRGAAPPPSPRLRVKASAGSMTIHWNGFRSERTRDPFSEEFDFEGYRVYVSETRRGADFRMLTSYDREDFNRFTFSAELDKFDLFDPPFTLAELQALYGPTFNPFNFGIDNPLTYIFQNGSSAVYYFSQQDYNSDDLGGPGQMSKLYPTAPRPNDDPEKWLTSDTTDGGFAKYYEYEFVVDKILPGKPLYVSVTAFDYGSPKSGLGSLESSVLSSAVQEFPLPDVDSVAKSNLEVIVYPNPYRGDGNYRDDGFEGRDRTDLPDERVQAVHFVNLPRICTITIYTIDGDLVRTIEHNFPNAGPGSMHEEWDLITRNSQPAVSGLYYYTVERPGGPVTVGKIVLVM